MARPFGSLTVGELKEFIKKHNLSDDAEIYYQRIPDIYFDPNFKGKWSTLDIPGEHYHYMLRDIEKANGEWNDKEQYPDRTQGIIDSFKNVTQEQLDALKENYIKVYTPIYYNDYPDKLFITAHI